MMDKGSQICIIVVWLKSTEQEFDINTWSAIRKFATSNKTCLRTTFKYWNKSDPKLRSWRQKKPQELDEELGYLQIVRFDVK